MTADAEARLALLEPWFEEAQRRGFIGPGLIEPHVAHAQGFGSVIGDPPVSLLDLGTGSGLPGLVLAAQWPDTAVVLLDAAEKRTALLAEVLEDLGWDAQVQVVRGRAEEVAREPRYRGRFAVVTARSFGAPAIVAECATGFLVTGGRLVVSEPPGADGSRWAAPGLAELGLAADGPPRGGYQVLVQDEATPDRYPRRVGIPAKRPLF